MNMLSLTRCLLAVTLLAVASSAQAVTIDFLPVGNAGNGANPVSYLASWGDVADDFQIGKYEVTMGQYTEFLNAVGATDTYGLFPADTLINRITQTGSSGSYTYAVPPIAANRPVVDVNWGDSVRFANWMHNGQPTGIQDVSTTELGAYDVLGAVSSISLGLVTRQAGAEFFLPTQDEWHKAAYHKNDGVTSNFWYFPTSSDVAPTMEAPAGGSNSANLNPGTYAVGAPDYVTDVGAYTGTTSAYGAFDMAGNVWEWTDTIAATGQHAPVMGGEFSHGTVPTQADYGVNAALDGSEAGTIKRGFRLAAPEAPPVSLCIIGDADCNGYVDIGGDILPAFTNFTGPGSFGKTRIEGDVHGPLEATESGDPHDGDVDVQDLLTMFGNFTGPAPDGSGLAAAEAGDANIPDLIYDAATGEVTLDVDGSGIIGYVLKNGDNSFAFGSHLQILAGVKTSVAGELSEAAFATSVGANSLGNVFPTGMNLAALSAYLTVNQVSRSLGAEVVPFDLVVLSTGPAVPEPATVFLSVFGLVGLGVMAYRRRAA